MVLLPRPVTRKRRELNDSAVDVSPKRCNAGEFVTIDNCTLICKKNPLYGPMELKFYASGVSRSYSKSAFRKNVL